MEYTGKITYASGDSIIFSADTGAEFAFDAGDFTDNILERLKEYQKSKAPIGVDIDLNINGVFKMTNIREIV